MINSPELNSIASSFRGWQIILSLRCELLFCRLKIIMVFFQSGQDEKWRLICDRSSKIMKNLIFLTVSSYCPKVSLKSNSIHTFRFSRWHSKCSPPANYTRPDYNLQGFCSSCPDNTSLCSKQGSWLPFLSPLVYPLCPKFPAAVPQMETAFSTLLRLSPLVNIVDAFTERWWWLKYKRGRNTTNHLNV